MQGIQTSEIFNIRSEKEFEQLAMEIFHYQVKENEVYKKFTELLGIRSTGIRTIADIPFLPIEFFKTRDVITDRKAPEIIFTSSGTTGTVQSRHLVSDINIYRESFRKAFSIFYGSPGKYAILALLPSYLERSGSSLIYMVEDLISQGNEHSGFYLYNHGELLEKLHELKRGGHKTLLIGVSFALLDFAESIDAAFPDLIIMETGGMKGRRKEMIREELHGILQEKLGVHAVHSEYGMTELLSQAYSRGKGIFECPPWMKVIIKDSYDPFTVLDAGKSGSIHIIDLANINSCSFIATQDLGRRLENNTFEVLGRFDNSDIRGCNLLIS